MHGQEDNSGLQGNIRGRRNRGRRSHCHSGTGNLALRPRGITMNSKTLALLCSLAVAAGCAADTNIAGTYEPSCIAFEGNTIELSDNRFTWDKFTDEVRIEED